MIDVPSSKNTTPPRPWALAATLLACLAASVSAQAATSASLSISNIRFTLVDLTPNDGIGPSAIYSGGGIALTTSGNLDDPTVVSAAMLGRNLPQIATADGFGSAITVSNGILLGTALGSANDVVEVIPQDSRHMTLQGDSRSEVWLNDGLPPETGELGNNEWTITLGANTGIRFDASYTIDLTASRQQSLDVAALALTQADPTRTVLGTTPYVSASASVFSWLQTGRGADVNASYSSASDAISLYNFTPCSPCADYVQQQTGTLSMYYANHSASTLDVFARLSGGVDAVQGATLAYTFPSPVGAVPEPGTWALMALGLLGLGWARRRLGD